jgi:UDP-N-acetylmuramoylalanine--D-glutamate ligase
MPSSEPICWSELLGRRVGVWGLGVEGQAARRKLNSLGVEPVLVDDRADTTGIPGALSSVDGGLAELARCEVVVKSPGISRYRAEVGQLEAAGVAVVGGLGLWLEEADRDRVILVTGTKGKSTTVSIMGHLLKAFGEPCFVGGNLGHPPFDPERPAGDGWSIIEVSSFQATDLWSATAVVGVTSLSPDHLDWHGSEQRYVADKLSLCRLPGAQLTVAAGNSVGLRQHRELLGPRVHWVAPPPDDTGAGGKRWVDELNLLGTHNRVNALVAAACLDAAGFARASDADALAEAAAGFSPLPSRLQVVGRAGGVVFVDDSLSTNVLPTIAALAAFPDRPVALLAGGWDRGIDYGPLADHLRDRTVPTLVLLLPDNGARIGAAVRAAGPMSAPLDVRPVTDVEEGVRIGADWARPSGVVLLSPAAPSFGRFADYQARSAAFGAAVRVAAGDEPEQLTTRPPRPPGRQAGAHPPTP